MELRHLGGAIARESEVGGAVSSFDSGFLMYAVGVTPDAATAAKVEAHVEVVTQALSPWAATVQYANFCELPSSRERFHDRETFRRLQRVKAQVDPAGIFTGAHPITAPSPRSDNPVYTPMSTGQTEEQG